MPERAGPLSKRRQHHASLRFHSRKWYWQSRHAGGSGDLLGAYSHTADLLLDEVGLGPRLWILSEVGDQLALRGVVFLSPFEGPIRVPGRRVQQVYSGVREDEEDEGRARQTDTVVEPKCPITIEVGSGGTKGIWHEAILMTPGDEARRGTQVSELEVIQARYDPPAFR